MSNLSEEFTFDVDEKSIESFKKAINYDEIEARYQRFMNGTETEDDLINGIYHYRIKNDNGLDLDVVEFKYYQKILDLYQKEKEKNENLSCDRILIQENVYKEIKGKIENINNYINKNKLFELLEIDNIDVIHCRLKQILEE